MDCERTVNCPYNVSHQISEERLQYHLVKCKRNHPWKENIHIFQVTKKATVLESELDCEWNKVGGLIPHNPATLPPLEEDWNEEYVQSPLQNIDASDKPVFRNLPGATKSERKMFRREERCRFEKVIETMKKSDKCASSRCYASHDKPIKKYTVCHAEKYTKPVEAGEIVEDNLWKSVKGRSQKRRTKKSSQEKTNVISSKRDKAKEATSTNAHEDKPINEMNNFDQLLVAFHDIGVSGDDNISNSPKNDEQNNSKSDVQSLSPKEVHCVQNSVFQEWDKILVHDLPTTVSLYDNTCSPSTSVDVLPANPKDNVGENEISHCHNPPNSAESLKQEQISEHDPAPLTTSVAPKHYSSIAASSPTSTGEFSNRIKTVGSRSAVEVIPTTRDKTPSTTRRLAETKTYENYTNLNTILGRKSRKVNKTGPPNEQSSSNDSIDASGLESKNIKNLGTAIRFTGFHSTPSLEPASDSLFGTQQDTTTFSYASILSKAPCSNI